jgi:hypothetical protein
MQISKILPVIWMTISLEAEEMAGKWKESSRVLYVESNIAIYDLFQTISRIGSCIPILSKLCFVKIWFTIFPLEQGKAVFKNKNKTLWRNSIKNKIQLHYEHRVGYTKFYQKTSGLLRKFWYFLQDYVQ